MAGFTHIDVFDICELNKEDLQHLAQAMTENLTEGAVIKIHARFEKGDRDFDSIDELLIQPDLPAVLHIVTLSVYGKGRGAHVKFERFFTRIKVYGTSEHKDWVTARFGEIRDFLAKKEVKQSRITKILQSTPLFCIFLGIFLVGLIRSVTTNSLPVAYGYAVFYSFVVIYSTKVTINKAISYTSKIIIKREGWSLRSFVNENKEIIALVISFIGTLVALAQFFRH